MKPTRCTLLLSIFISTSVHVSCNYVSIIRRTYCIYATLVIFHFVWVTVWSADQTVTHLLTPWCRVLLEQLTGLQLAKKFPAFHGIRRFITALTSVRHMSLSWVSPIQSTYPHPTSWRSILILSTRLRLGLPSGLFPFGFPTKILYTHTERNMPVSHRYSKFSWWWARSCPKHVQKLK